MRNYQRVVASCLLILICSLSSASTWRVWRDAIRTSPNPDATIEELKTSIDDDDAVYEQIEAFQSAKTAEGKKKTRAELMAYLDAMVISEDIKPQAKATEDAVAIKSKPEYNIERNSASATWIEDLMNRLRGLKGPEVGTPNLPTVPPLLGQILNVIFYGLIVAAIGFIVYLITKIPIALKARAKKGKKGMGILEEGEELLSEDEYLLKAEELISLGKFREACRALYLASLLRIDSSKIARFEPTETNWEHQRRIDKSPKLPEGFSFRPVTKAFDLAWYGYEAKTAESVEIFKSVYIQIKQMTTEVK